MPVAHIAFLCNFRLFRMRRRRGKQRAAFNFLKRSTQLQLSKSRHVSASQITRSTINLKHNTKERKCETDSEGEAKRDRQKRMDGGREESQSGLAKLRINFTTQIKSTVQTGPRSQISSVPSASDKDSRKDERRGRPTKGRRRGAHSPPQTGVRKTLVRFRVTRAQLTGGQ